MSQLAASLQYLGNAPPAVQVKLLQTCLSFLLDPRIDFQLCLSELAPDSGMNAASFKSASQGVLVLFGEALQHGIESSFLKKKCNDMMIDADLTSTIIGVWTLNARSISIHLLSKIVTQNQLLDVEWCFGVTSASDDCDNVGKTFLQLKLVIGVSQDNQSRRTLFIELSLDHFYQLLASLEKCKQFIDYVSPR